MTNLEKYCTFDRWPSYMLWIWFEIKTSVFSMDPNNWTNSWVKMAHVRDILKRKWKNASQLAKRENGHWRSPIMIMILTLRLTEVSNICINPELPNWNEYGISFLYYMKRTAILSASNWVNWVELIEVNIKALYAVVDYWLIIKVIGGS